MESANEVSNEAVVDHAKLVSNQQEEHQQAMENFRPRPNQAQNISTVENETTDVKARSQSHLPDFNRVNDAEHPDENFQQDNQQNQTVIRPNHMKGFNKTNINLNAPRANSEPASKSVDYGFNLQNVQGEPNTDSAEPSNSNKTSFHTSVNDSSKSARNQHLLSQQNRETVAIPPVVSTENIDRNKKPESNSFVSGTSQGNQTQDSGFDFNPKSEQNQTVFPIYNQEVTSNQTRVDHDMPAQISKEANQSKDDIYMPSGKLMQPVSSTMNRIRTDDNRFDHSDQRARTAGDAKENFASEQDQSFLTGKNVISEQKDSKQDEPEVNYDGEDTPENLSDNPETVQNLNDLSRKNDTSGNGRSSSDQELFKSTQQYIDKASDVFPESIRKHPKAPTHAIQNHDNVKFDQDVTSDVVDEEDNIERSNLNVQDQTTQPVPSVTNATRKIASNIDTNPSSTIAGNASADDTYPSEQILSVPLSNKIMTPQESGSQQNETHLYEDGRDQPLSITFNPTAVASVLSTENFTYPNNSDSNPGTSGRSHEEQPQKSEVYFNPLNGKIQTFSPTYDLESGLNQSNLGDNVPSEVLNKWNQSEEDKDRSPDQLTQPFSYIVNDTITDADTFDQNNQTASTVVVAKNENNFSKFGNKQVQSLLSTNGTSVYDQEDSKQNNAEIIHDRKVASEGVNVKPETAQNLYDLEPKRDAIDIGQPDSTVILPESNQQDNNKFSNDFSNTGINNNQSRGFKDHHDHSISQDTISANFDEKAQAEDGGFNIEDQQVRPLVTNSTTAITTNIEKNPSSTISNAVNESTDNSFAYPNEQISSVPLSKEIMTSRGPGSQQNETYLYKDGRNQSLSTIFDPTTFASVFPTENFTSNNSDSIPGRSPEDQRQESEVFFNHLNGTNQTFSPTYDLGVGSNQTSIDYDVTLEALNKANESEEDNAKSPGKLLQTVSSTINKTKTDANYFDQNNQRAGTVLNVKTEDDLFSPKNEQDSYSASHFRNTTDERAKNIEFQAAVYKTVAVVSFVVALFTVLLCRL